MAGLKKTFELFGQKKGEEIKEIVLGDLGDTSVLSAEIMEQVKAEQDLSKQVNKGLSSSGTVLFAKDPSLMEGPTPADNIVIEVNPVQL